MYNQIKQKKKLEAVRVHTCEQDGTCVCVSEKAQAVTCGVAAQLRLLTLMSNRDFASSFTADSLGVLGFVFFSCSRWDYL